MKAEEIKYTYDQALVALGDRDTDEYHQYNAGSQEWDAACAVCGRPTTDLCVLCTKPACHHCLHNIHLPELRDENPAMVDSEWGPERAEPDYEYGRVCLPCFVKHERHPPYSWGWGQYRFISWAGTKRPGDQESLASAIRKGTISPAGDLDSWVSNPDAADVVQLHHKPEHVVTELDAFELRSLLTWMDAWRPLADQMASAASTTLVAYHTRAHQRAREADRGYIDYSQFE